MSDAVALHDLVDPRQENLRIDRAVERDRHGLHLGVVQHLWRMIVVIVLVIAMVVIVRFVAAIRAARSSCS